MGRIQFLMDTNGHCFVCLKFIPSTTYPISFETGGGVGAPNVRVNDPKICSFRNICEYLKINLWEVSNEALPLNSGSLPVLEKSELKGVLCEGCVPLLDRFSKDFVELEGIRMKLQHSLKSIYEQMLAAEKSEGKATERSEREILLRKQAALKNGFVEQLRRKTLERCSVVMETGHPLLLPKQTQILAEEPMSSTQYVVEGQPGETQMLVIPQEPKIDNISQPLDHMPDPSIGLPATTDDDDDITVIHEARVEISGEGPKCNLCEKIFAHASDLQNHRMDVHMNRQFQCDYCPKRFSMAIVKNQHMQRRCPLRFAKATNSEGKGRTVTNLNEKHDQVPTTPKRRGRGRPKTVKGDRTDKDTATQEHNLQHDISHNTRFPKRKSKYDSGTKGDMYKFEFECDHCHKTFALKFQRDRHQRVCLQPENPSKFDSSQNEIQNDTDQISEPTHKRKIISEVAVAASTPPIHHAAMPQLPIVTEDGTCVEPDISPDSIIQVNEVYPQLCKFCNKKLNSKKIMKRHLASVHKATEECEVCHAAFKSKQGLRTHRITVHLQQRVQCQFCSKIFSQVSNRNHHMRSACPNRGTVKSSTNAKPSLPPTASPAKKKQVISQTQSKKVDIPPPHLDGPFDEDDPEMDSFFTEVECDVCQEKVSDPASHKCTQLETTLKFNQQGEVVGEEVIPKLPLLTIPEPPSTSSKNVKMSVDRETGNTKCGACSKIFPRKSVFLNHYMSSHLNTTYLCNLCGKEYYHRSDYTRHHRESHSGIRFRCELCVKMFSQREKLIEHRQSVHFPKGYNPDEEDQSNPAPATQDDAEKDTATGPVPSIAINDKPKIKCTECPRQFIYEVNYQEHYKNMHSSDDVKFECNQCLKKFTGYLNLLRHKENVHRGSRFCCDICNKLFTQKCNLEAHKRAFHFGKTFACTGPGCSKEFPSAAKMKLHMRVKKCGKDKNKSRHHSKK